MQLFIYSYKVITFYPHLQLQLEYDSDEKKKKKKKKDEDEDDEDSEEEDEDDEPKKRGRPPSGSKGRVRGFTDADIRKFVKSFKKFGKPLSRYYRNQLMIV